MDSRCHVRNRVLGLILAAGACVAWSAATAAENPQQVDALVVEARCDIEEGCQIDVVVIPRSQLAFLCGDSDGCTLRLSAALGRGDDMEFGHQGTYFKTSADGYSWWRNVDIADPAYRYGALDTAPDQSIYAIDLGHNFASGCSLVEEKIGIAFVASYVLRASVQLPDLTIECPLRIDD